MKRDGKGSKFARRCILGRGGTSLKSVKGKRKRARNAAELEAGERRGPLYIMRRVPRELHGGAGNKCSMKRRMRETRKVVM